MCLFFCFKQKTAYEMRISDWSSDVCSSDLMAAQQIGGLETDDDRGELRQSRIESERAAGADDRGRHREPDQRRADEQQFLPVPVAAAPRRGGVGEDEPAGHQPVDEEDRKSTRLNSSH